MSTPTTTISRKTLRFGMASSYAPLTVLVSRGNNRAMPPFERDPLSVRFDPSARRLVERAYAVKGSWAGDFVPPPGPRARLWMAAHGIYSPYERDRWGEIRWLRAYKRSVYHLVNWYGGTTGLRGERNSGAGSEGWHAPVRVEWETGVRVREGVHAGRWAVRIRIHPGGRATSRIGLARAAREGNAWMTADGHQTFRASTAADHEWA